MPGDGPIALRLARFRNSRDEIIEGLLGVEIGELESLHDAFHESADALVGLPQSRRLRDERQTEDVETVGSKEDRLKRYIVRPQIRRARLVECRDRIDILVGECLDVHSRLKRNKLNF